MSDFEYISPQFIDFSASTELQLQEFGEEYFDVDHENDVQQIIEIRDSNYEDISSPNLSQSFSDKFLDAEAEPEFQEVPLRKSASAGNLPEEIMNKNVAEESSLIEAFSDLHLHSAKKPRMVKINGVYRIVPSKPKTPCHSNSSKKGTLNKATKATLNKPRSVSKDAINKISQENLKRKISSESLNSHLNHPNKYITLAEAIRSFQFDIPKRFHTQSSKAAVTNIKNTAATNCTVPESPMLTTKTRNRPTNYISQEEQEELEAIEMKKHQIKAHPVNYKILMAPAEIDKPKRRVTSVKPFNFTEVKFQRKPVSEKPKEVYEFHARPAPKTTAPGTIPIPKKPVLTAVPATSQNVNTTTSFRRKYKVETLPKICENGENNKLTVETMQIKHDGLAKTVKQRRTEIKPFSFEERNKKTQEKKAQKIKELLEEEKKARIFHARPLSSKVVGHKVKIESKIYDAPTSYAHYSKSTEENIAPENKSTFKARPATVIYKKPFVPKKESKPLTEIQKFSLQTIQRSKAREQYDKKLKEKEQQQEELKKMNEVYVKALENLEIKKLRQQTIHKAKPMKSLKPLEIHPSTKPLTTPKTPMTLKRIKKTSESEK